MIDSYFDRADAATGYRPAPPVAPNYDSLHYWQGNWYVSVIDRMVAEAKDKVRISIGANILNHRREIRHGVPLGSGCSIFDSAGRLRKIWSQP
jgi:hypothetical protein